MVNASTRYVLTVICDEDGTLTLLGLVQSQRGATHERNQHANTQKRGANDRNNPMCLVIRCPPIHEQRKGHEERAGDHRRQPVLRLLHPVLLRQILQHLIRCRAQHEEPNQRSNSDAQVREAHRALREAVLALEDLADGREEEVEVAVDDADVEGEEEDDGREEEHFCGADDTKHEEVFRGAACVEGGAEVGVACFFLEFLRLAGEEGGCVRFADGDE